MRKQDNRKGELEMNNSTEQQKKQVTEQATLVQNMEYKDYVKQVTPKNNLGVQMAKAFLVGGSISLIGQMILNVCENVGLDKELAGAYCSLILVLVSVVLTGFNIYPSIAKFGGAGALVPITGFANSVAAPAIEYKVEGQIFGILQGFGHNLGRHGSPGTVLHQGHGAVLIVSLGQTVEEGVHIGEYITVVGGRSQNKKCELYHTAW